MFGGLITHMGTVRLCKKQKDWTLLTVEIEKPWDNIVLGQSVAVNGVCLTCIDFTENTLSFQLINPTYRTTNLGLLKTNSPVNLERPLQLSSYLDGHLCSGHIDDMGHIQNMSHRSETADLDIQYPQKYQPFVISKGSIAVDGVSLTIISCEKNSFRISLIPHTFKNTRFMNNTIGDCVNLEFDALGKYVAAQMNSLKN